MLSPSPSHTGSAEHNKSKLLLDRGNSNEFTSYPQDELVDTLDASIDRDGRAAPLHTVHSYMVVRNFIGWPFIVIFGQLVLQGLAWGFFATVKIRGQVVLPHSSALWFERNPHLVTLLITLISTFLAACSSFLFSYALRRSMSLYLYRPITLATLGASVSISTRSVFFSRRSLKWPLLSILILILSGIQTSGWSTLFTPVKIVISTPLSGRELDLASPIFDAMVAAENSTGPECINGAVMSPVAQMDAGYAAAKKVFGFETSVGFVGQTFNVSTGGIWPANFDNVNMSRWMYSTD
ncbi:hypothetical protein B0H19DRAFT_1377884 [Mycena capillaripes]|nr:hypothetical protein B0H19DRAFT_1377884 [Mycena capillaripes]